MSALRLAATVCAALLPLLVRAGVIAPELAQELATRSAADDVPVIIQFADRVEPAALAVADRRRRDGALVRALRDKADRVQRDFRPVFEQVRPRNVRQLWVINAVAAVVRAGDIEALAKHPAVGRIQLDAVIPLAATTTAPASNAGWNVAAVQAPDVWSRGYTGTGIVVANMDSGVDPLHPDLAGKWRGGGNSWFDPYGQYPAPHDANGHGTQTMGLIVGGAASGTAIGMAPDARWIAARIFDDAGQGTFSAVHLAFQWLLDPDGNPATVDAPDVVNASWALDTVPGTCNQEFGEDIGMLKAAGILVVFAAGNEGPSAASSVSPGNNPGAFPAGAVDSTLAVASLSSRGPSACDASVFPKLVAPGVNVVTSDLSFGGMPVYASVTGTSFAAPHVAGSLALLAQAFPAATIALLEAALTNSAQDLGPAGADNDAGYGLVHALAALDLLAGGGAGGNAPAITSVPPTSVTENQAWRYQVAAADPDGGTLAFAVDVAPAGMAIDASSGLATWTPSHAQVGANAVTLRVTDPTGLSATQAFSVTVLRANTAPVSANDSYGVTSGNVLTVAAPGVLANDADAEGDVMSAVLTATAAHGTLTLNADGSFRYAPASGYSGPDGFSYLASDGAATGNSATVSITVTAAANTAPVAVDDAYAAPARTGNAYTAKVLSVLANDRDPDGALDMGSVSIVVPPSQGGTATVNANGTVSYVPRQKFKGTETFRYQVKDNRGAVSNPATVTLTVR